MPKITTFPVMRRQGAFEQILTIIPVMSKVGFGTNSPENTG